jgi:hypothetical protein
MAEQKLPQNLTFERHPRAVHSNDIDNDDKV